MANLLYLCKRKFKMEKNMETKSYQVNGMACVHCKARVENAIKALEGVTHVKADLNAKNVTISFDSSKLSDADFQQAVEDAGYEFVG